MSRCRSSRKGAASAAPALIVAWVALTMARLGGHLVQVRADDTLNVNVTDALVFTGVQLEVLANDVLVELGMFTSYTDTDGLWITVKDSGDYYDQTVWTSGMVAGMFWYQYAATGEEMWKTRAEFFLEGLEGVEETDDNDLGFQVFDSFGLGYKLISDPDDKAAYKERVLTGANTLHDNRWAANIPAFWSWANLTYRPEWERAVNIDMMMNMEILLWSNEHGDSDAESYGTKVEAHANQTWIDIVRDDNSTYHAADYDPDTGELVDQGTYQGYSDNSTWTRGQAWGIYGNVMVYRFRKKPHFLSYCLGLLEYWEDNIPDDLVPPSDFDAPDDSDNGKDSSASAIVASAYFELFITTEDAAYLKRAQEYLFALMSPDADYFQPYETDGWQSILRRAMSKWGANETGAVFGDYFFLESLVRYQDLAPSILLWDEAEVTVNAAVDSFSADVTQWKETGHHRKTRRSLRNSVSSVPEAKARRLKELQGGKYCKLSVSGSTVQLADTDCIPVPPDFDDLDATTPSPSVLGAIASPTSASSSEGSTAGGGSFSPTISPVEASVAPSSTENGAISSTIVFSGSDLDNDVGFAFLDTTAPVFFWCGVTLSNTFNVPSTVTLKSDAGETVEGAVMTPEDDWKTGLNKVHFAIELGAMAEGSWKKVESVTVKFVVSDASEGEDTDVIMDWLVVSNELAL